MSLLSNLNPLGWVQAVAKPISEGYQAKQARRQAYETGQAKLTNNRQENAHQLELTDAEWEAISVRQNTDTWKDEYVTIVMTLPIISTFAGVFWGTLKGNAALLEAVAAANSSLLELMPNYQYIAASVILAAVGIKALKKGIK